MTPSDERPQRSARRRRRHRAGLASLVVGLVLAAALGGLWQWRLAIAERVLPAIARSAEIELVAARATRLDFSGADFADLRFGRDGGQRIEHLQIGWTLGDLRRGSVRTIAISGASLNAVIGPGGAIGLDGLLAPRPPNGGAGEFALPARLPFERIEVAASRLAVALPDGRAEIAIDGYLEPSADGVAGEIDARYSAETRRGSGKGSGSAALVWQRGGALRGTFDLNFGRLVAPGVAGEKIRIAGTAAGLPRQPERLSLTVEASAERLESARLSGRNLTASVELADGVADVAGAGRLAGWAVKLSARLRPFDLTRPAAFTVQANGEAAVLAGLSPTVTAAGQVALAADGAIAQPGELLAMRNRRFESPRDILGRLAELVAGRLTVETELSRFAVADAVTTGEISARLDGRWADGVLDIDIADSARIEGLVLAPPLSQTLADWLPDGLPLEIVFRHGMGSPPTVRVRQADDGFAVRMIGGVALASPGGTIGLDLDGAVATNRYGGLDRVELAALSATLTDLSTRAGTLSGDVLVTDLTGAGDRLNAVVAADLSANGFALAPLSGPPVTAGALTATLDGVVDGSAERVRVRLSPGGEVAARDVRLSGDPVLAGPTRLRLAGGDHLLAFDRPTGEVSIDARLAPGDVRIQAGARKFDVAYGPLAVGGEWPGTLRVDAAPLDVRGDDDRAVETGGLRLRARGTTADAEIDITADAAALRLPGLTLPRFDVKAALSHRGPSVDVDIAIAATAGHPNLRARIRHDLATGTGVGEIVEANLRFAPGVLQPADLRPQLAGLLRNVFADIALRGPVAWDSSGALSPNLTLEADGLAATTDHFELSDGAATIAVTGLPRLTSPPGQQFTGTVRIGRLEPAPFEVSFQLLPGPQLIVERVAAAFAGGRLTADRFSLRPPSLDAEVTLRLEAVDLAPVFALLGNQGLGGTGRVSGEIPVTVRGSRLAIAGGRLRNEGPGTVFFDISALPQRLVERGDTVSLVLRALSQFRYDDLRIDMDKALAGPGTVRVRLAGANPEVLDNQPFVFNISLETDFDRLATLVLEGLTTSQGLLRALALSPGAAGGPGAPPSP